MQHLKAAIAAVIGLALVSTCATAQGWPSKAIRIVTPSPAGVGADAYARAYAEQLSKALGQPVIVENRPGAGGTLGTDAVVKAAPDGHTLLFSTSLPVTVLPHLMPKITYKAQTDLVPVSPSVTGGSYIISGPNQPFADFKALIAAAKAEPNKISFASYGPGSTSHIGLELLQDAAGVQFLHVPFKQSAMSDLMGGHVQIGFEPPGSALSAARTGKAKILAFTAATRSKAMPDIPTVAELYPGYIVTSWLGFWAPAGTPDDIVGKLNVALANVTGTPEVEKLMTAAGTEPMNATPAELKAIIARESEAMEKLIKAKGIKLE